MDNHMVQLLRDQSPTRTMGTVARQQIVTNYSVTRHLDLLHQTINEAVISRG